MFEEALTARMLATPGIAQLVGSRFNWLDRPEGDALPSITAQIIDAGTEYTHEKRDELVYSDVQFDCWGRTYASAKQVARALCFELDKAQDAPSVEFYDGVEVRHRDMPVETLDGGTKVFRILVEYLVPHKVKGA